MFLFYDCIPGEKSELFSHITSHPLRCSKEGVGAGSDVGSAALTDGHLIRSSTSSLKAQSAEFKLNGTRRVQAGSRCASSVVYLLAVRGIVWLEI